MGELQKSINAIIDKIMPPEVFLAAADIATKVKNTFGVHCPKCKSDNVYERAQQVRASDEISTIFMECLSCGYKWRIG